MNRTTIPLVIERVLTRSMLAQATDAELLRRFAETRNAEAFNELIQRHAAVVWSVCRRGCQDRTIAEDAFQTTFLTLARQARHVKEPDCLAGWLYAIARRTINRLRPKAMPTITLVPATAQEPSPVDKMDQREFMAAVEEEVARLPEKYRAAVLLCWFEEESLEAVASRLGITKDTLWGRLKYAREQLRKRLAARGYGLATVLGTSLLTETNVDAQLVHQVAQEATRVTFKKSLLPHLAAGLLLATTAALGVAGLMPTETPIAKKEPHQETPKSEGKPTTDGFPLPNYALQRFGNRQLRHPEAPTDMAVSRDGRYLATGGYQSVVVWDTKTLSAKLTINMQLNYATKIPRLIFLPDGQSLLVAVHDEPKPHRNREDAKNYQYAQVWNIETGTMTFAIRGEYAYHNSSWLAGNEKEMVTYYTSGDTRELIISDLRDGHEIKRLAAPLAYHGVWVSGDGETIAYQGRDEKGLTLLAMRTNEVRYSLPDIRVNSLTMSHDGKQVIFGTGDTVHVHDVHAKKELFSFKHPEGNTEAPMRLSKDGKTLYFGSPQGHLCRWDLARNREIKGLGRHSLWTLTNLALSPDERTLYTLGQNKVVQRWDLATGQPQPVPDGYTTMVQMLPAHDRTSLFIGDHGGWLHRWDLATGQRVQSYLKEAGAGVNCLAQSPDGKLLAVGRVSQDVQLWDIAQGTLLRTIPLVEKNDIYGGDQVQQVDFSPDGKTVYSVSPKTGLTAWDVATGLRRWQRSESGQLLAFDPLGRWLISHAFYKHPIPPSQVLDAATGKPIGTFEILQDDLAGKANAHAFYPPYVTSSAVRGDGSRLLTAHADGTLREWDTATWKEVRRLRTGKLGAMRVAFSPDGRWFAWAHGREVAIWDFTAGKEVVRRTGHHSEITQVAFTHDGRHLLTNADLAPVLWDIAPHPLREVKLTADELFEALASDDVVNVYALQWALIREPAKLIALARERIQPERWGVDQTTFKQWVADLDSPRFAVREQATKKITEADSQIPLSWLRNVVQQTGSTEVRDRINRVLEQRAKTPDRVGERLARIVQVLELANTMACRALLHEWASAKVDSSPAQQAKAALKRLGPALANEKQR